MITLTEEDRKLGGEIVIRDGKEQIFFPVDFGYEGIVYMSKDDMLDMNMKAGAWHESRRIMGLIEDE